jgi:hypothetical protein
MVWPKKNVPVGTIDSLQKNTGTIFCFWLAKRKCGGTGLTTKREESEALEVLMIRSRGIGLSSCSPLA